MKNVLRVGNFTFNMAVWMHDASAILTEGVSKALTSWHVYDNRNGIFIITANFYGSVLCAGQKHRQ